MTLWHGVVMKTADEQQVVVRAALLCAACDIPAARKTCGFVGHGGSVFPTEHFGEKAATLIVQNGPSVLMKPPSSNVAAQAKDGVRYSVLLELPYFDAPRMCIVDPMHNLLLGSAL